MNKGDKVRVLHGYGYSFHKDKKFVVEELIKPNLLKLRDLSNNRISVVLQPYCIKVKRTKYDAIKSMNDKSIIILANAGHKLSMVEFIKRFKYGK
jgi:hypothetical protein